MIYYFTKDRALSSECSSSTVNCKDLHLRICFEFLFPWGSGRANPLLLPLPRSSRAALRAKLHRASAWRQGKGFVLGAH